MTKNIHAPYNFAPLSGWIFQPHWAAQVSQDIPFQDGFSGTLDLTIKAHSPILVGGEKEPSTEDLPGKVAFFKTPQGQCAIPGSSLKGMIRNVLEIASFGKMDQVDDRWLSIRDLTPGAKEIYRDKISDKDIKPLAKAGFLRPVSGDRWELIPCDFARVDHQDLISWGNDLGIECPGKIRKEQKSPDKYKIWGKNLDVKFDMPDPRKTYKKSTSATPEWQKAGNLGKGSKSGRLVFTGQPQTNNVRSGGFKSPDPRKKRARPKYLEFIFYNEKTPIEVEGRVIRAFLHVHQDTDEWKFWQKRFHIHLGVPVFYLEQAGYPTNIGLALMFRLAYEQTIGQAIEKTHHGHRDSKFRDLPELMFGMINDNDRGLKSRVSFGMACLEGKPILDKQPPTVLNSPKPSYYPAYIEQPHCDRGLLKGDRYNTLMDSDAEVRGWKRYPARPTIGGLQTRHKLGHEARKKKGKDNNRIKVIMHPLQKGSVFKGRLRVHNLNRFELGALLWALTWGGKQNLRHGLGMGKPFGLGQVSLSVDPESWKGIKPNNPSNPVPDQADLIAHFQTEMNRFWDEAVEKKTDQSWEKSEQMVQLLAMANPQKAPGLPGSLDYMELGSFLEKKGRTMGDFKRVLLPYDPYTGEKDHDLFPRRTRQQWEKLEADRKAEREKEEERAQLSPLERQLKEDLEDAPNPGERAQNWLARLAQEQESDALVIAKALKQYYAASDNWSGKLAKKQKDKVRQIKAVLGESS